jgi:monoamine oxidase
MLAYARGVRMGGVVKVFVSYAHAFWGKRGERYMPTGLIRSVFDNGDEPPLLMCFVVGEEARRWRERDPAERRADVIAILGGGEPTGYLEQDWSADPWSGGCVAATPPGLLASGTRWREPHGRIRGNLAWDGNGFAHVSSIQRAGSGRL